ncbi:MAG: agmatinase [Cyclobacteriaceae bacterium]
MVTVLGIPFDANSSFLKGPALAPDRIRLMEKEGSANLFSELGREIKNGVAYTDKGDLSFETTNPEKAFSIIKNAIASELTSSNKILSFGGDHSVSYPIIDAFSEKYKNLNVLHIDAHSDLYDNFDNNLYSHASPFARLLEKRKLDSLTQVGIRCATAHLREQAKKYNARVVEMKDFNFDFIQHLKAPLYISLDIDSLDPAFAPGVSHHEPGGFTTRQLIQIIHQIPVSIVGADIVEYNPIRDIHNMTAMVCYKLMKELIHKMNQ